MYVSRFSAGDSVCVKLRFSIVTGDKNFIGTVLKPDGRLTLIASPFKEMPKIYCEPHELEMIEFKFDDSIKSA